MKKILKITAIIALLIMSVFILTGCGEAKSKIAEYSNQDYYIKLKEEGTDTIYELSKNGKNYALFAEETRCVEKDGKLYSMSDEEKLMVIETGIDYNSPDSLSDLDIYKKINIKEENVNKKTETINGVEYECEETEEMKFYFLNGEMKMYKETIDGNTITIEVLEYKNKAKDELFNIPTDYEIVEE